MPDPVPEHASHTAATDIDALDRQAISYLGRPLNETERSLLEVYLGGDRRDRWELSCGAPYPEDQP